MAKNVELSAGGVLMDDDGRRLTVGALAATGGTTGQIPTVQADGTIALATPSATSETLVTATDGATVTFDVSAGTRQIVTLGGNRTLAVTNDTAHPVFTVIIATGAGGFTPTWWSGIRWIGGNAPTLTATASKYDVFSFVRVSAGVYLGFIVGQAL